MAQSRGSISRPSEPPSPIWFEQVYRGLRTVTASLTGQTATLAATTLLVTTPPAPSGLFRVWWYAAVVTAAGVSSSLTVTIGWTDQGVAKAFSGAAMTGNTTATQQSQALMIRADAHTAVTYAAVYASNAAAAMVYTLDVRAEALPVEASV